MSGGAAEKTRTSTDLTPQRPQRCASTSSATAAVILSYVVKFKNQPITSLCKLIIS